MTAVSSLLSALALMALLTPVVLVPMSQEYARDKVFLEELEELKEVLEEELEKETKVDNRGAGEGAEEQKSKMEEEKEEHIRAFPAYNPIIDAYHAAHSRNRGNALPERNQFRYRQIAASDIICSEEPAMNCLSIENSQYRTFNGTCNNLHHPHWGSAGSLHLRIPQYGIAYQDGTSATQTRGVDGTLLPNARHVSNVIMKANNTDLFAEPDLDKGATLMVMQWGQFLDHEIVETESSKFPADTSVCCDDDERAKRPQNETERCLEIRFNHVSSREVYPETKNCIPNKRSAQYPDCKYEVPILNQRNGVTPYIDASMIYGNDKYFADSLRDPADRSLMAVTPTPIGKANLPLDDDPSSHNICPFIKTDPVCYQAGDIRANEQTGLTMLHQVFVREHNRIVRKLKASDSSLSEEDYYQVARKIVGAEIQQITYHEFLPEMIEKKLRKNHDIDLDDEEFTTGKKGAHEYNGETEAGVFSNWAMGFRVGHVLAMNFIQWLTKSLDVHRQMPLSQLYFRPSNLNVSLLPDDFQGIVRFYATQPLKQFNRFMVEELRSHLFRPPGRMYGEDLATLNVIRGRDWGTVKYNNMRRHCGLNVSSTFSGTEPLPDMTQEVTDLLNSEEMYKSPEDIDLFVGMICETPKKSGLGGPLLQCILAKQFQNLRLYDRFFYDHENSATFTRNAAFNVAQVTEIKTKITLANILCKTVFDPDEKIQEKVMAKPKGKNKMKLCSDYDDMDYGLFIPIATQG